MTWISDFTSKNAPIVALAPMDGYCDSAFRAICRTVAPNIVVFSEFYSADGLHHNPLLAKRVLTHDPIEHPLVFQIFGNTPEVFLSAGKIIESYGAQGVDINMGCPAKKVVKCGYGSGLMVDRDRAMKIVNILAENLNIPVSVKTRLGWNNADDLVEFGKCIEQAGAKLITVHGRTYQQEYTGAANWEPMFELQKALKIPVVGNGDCKGFEDGIIKVQRARPSTSSGSSGPEGFEGSKGQSDGLLKDPQLGTLNFELLTGEHLAGFMVARGALGNPWCFLPGNYEPTWTERLGIMAEHMERMVATKGENRACLEIRKHFTHYLHGFEGVRDYRKRLAMVTSVSQTIGILDELKTVNHDQIELKKA